MIMDMHTFHYRDVLLAEVVSCLFLVGRVMSEDFRPLYQSLFESSRFEKSCTYDEIKCCLGFFNNNNNNETFILIHLIKFRELNVKILVYMVLRGTARMSEKSD